MTPKEYRWKHNAMRGHVAMSKKHMQAIMQSTSTTQAAKKKALAIRGLLEELDFELLTRVDP